MVKTLSIVAICIALIALIGFCIDRFCIDKTHRYRIEYPHGRHAFCDYTDSFVVEGGIRYVNEYGDSVHRFGTFSVGDNPDYKK